jgi:hypothetical protein
MRVAPPFDVGPKGSELRAVSLSNEVEPLACPSATDRCALNWKEGKE